MSDPLVLDPYQMAKRIKALEQELAFLTHLNAELMRINARLAMLQPPAAIILQVTPEQLEKAKELITRPKI